MAMCKHSQEFETCRFGCTFRKAADLRLENDKLEEELEEYRATFGNQGLLQKAETENTQLQAENKELRDDFETIETIYNALRAENEQLKKETQARGLSFKGWIVMRCECVPSGQIWMNPNEPALQDNKSKTDGAVAGTDPQKGDKDG